MPLKRKNADGTWSNVSGGSYTPMVTTCALPIAGWSAESPYTQTVSLPGMTASKNILVTPAPASFTEWADKGVYCSAQGDNTLTFSCGSIIPASDLTANIIIL